MSAPVAFFSYVNDADEDGVLGQLAQRLERRVRLAGVEDFRIFVDRQDIAWGDRWQEVLRDSVTAATILIPIIVPLYFKRPWCREELERFVRSEDGRRRILPVLWMSMPGLDPRADDPLVRAIAERQYADWRDLQFEGVDSAAAKRKLNEMAERIAGLVLGSPARPAPSASPGRDARVEGAPPTGDRAALARLLLSLFSADELRRFVRYGPDGDGIVSRLPTATASPASLADAVVDAYVSDGLVDAAFFARLLADRPRRKPDIDVVRGTWGV